MMETMDAEMTTNILLVDDRNENLLALEAVLEPLGQRLVKASSGEEALRHLLRQDFAVILLDVQMPGLDGFETAALVKEREKSRHIPIIFLTAISKDAHFVFKGYSVGAVDYISKPFDPDILRSKVSVFVDLYRKNEQLKRQSELLQASEKRERERQVAELKRASERRYKQLAESMPQIVWTARADGALTYLNRRWLDYTGVAPDDAAERGLERAIHPSELKKYHAQWGAAVENGDNFEATYRFRRGSDGDYRWHLVRAIPIRGDDGSVASWIGTNTDIDDRKRAEEALRLLAEASTVLAGSLDYRATLADVARLVVPGIADWCVIDVVDEEGSLRRIGYVHEDPASVDLLAEISRRYPADREIGCGAGSVMSTSVPEFVPEVDDAYLAAVALDDDHLGCLQRLGMRSCMTVPLVARGRALGTITLATGSSERRFTTADLTLAEDLARRAASAIDTAQLYEVAERERAKLEEANRAKDEFLAMVSHELRTPLNSMLGWTQLLRSGKLDSELMARAIETVERNATSQAQIIDDLLDVSRIVTGKLKLKVQRVDLGEVIDSALESVGPALKAKSIELTTDVDVAGSTAGDPDRLQQIVWNLLTNAIKFTPPGGRIAVRVARDEDEHLLEVEDSGVGISKEFLPFVFERFRQADASSTRLYGGLGLGLSIVRHLVELHGGRVAARSEGSGKGATFRVWLPIAVGAEEESDETDYEAVAGGAMPLAGVRVLLVEDEPDGKEVFRLVLERGGADVRAVSSAPEALDAFDEETPDLLISDIGLPGDNGYDLIKSVRALGDENGGATPAIAVTAYAAAGDRDRALEAGFQRHVAKPVDPPTLVKVVLETLARSRAREISRRAVGRESSGPSPTEG
jgi:PAS domain S-box-containing protein